jgi:hypothetical protein
MKEQQIDVANMTIEKALIAQGQGPQLLRTTVDIDWYKKRAECQFSTVDVRFSFIFHGLPLIGR